ncbi:MAG TPA: phosphohydrolase [Syntrophobacteraceae bacterium]|nr:phosphohydrolase [Syntrophobacteraceae bacterium]HBZ53951.1 phosphohydrolase [Syntrophobacteraceae bacterium]
METKGSDVRLKRVIHFFFEIGMLKKTPRSGFQFLGSGKESVADHTFRVAVIGFSMARLTGRADPFKVACLCLFHDVPEARTGDLNYLNKRYVDVHERRAIVDLTESLPFAEDMLNLLSEYEQGQSLEAQLAHDADQLDLVLELKQQSDLGNRYALEWVRFARARLQTDVGRELAEGILCTDFNAWWFEGHDHWWERS